VGFDAFCFRALLLRPSACAVLLGDMVDLQSQTVMAKGLETMKTVLAATQMPAAAASGSVQDGQAAALATRYVLFCCRGGGDHRLTKALKEVFCD
jgi:hypothetical protein